MTGEVMLSEIREQPLALLRLLDQERELETITTALARRSPSVVRLVGHGTSDNAASYGIYVLGLLPGWTALRDSISLTIYYGASIDFGGSGVIALSQSGRTPDVVEHVARRAGGALTLALTNDPARARPAAELAAARRRPGLGRGDEDLPERARRARPARRRRGRQGPGGRGRPRRRTRRLPPRSRSAVAPGPAACAFVGRMFVIGRGLGYATAREIALKLTETCRVAAGPDGDGSSSTPRRSPFALPGLGHRLAGREPARGRRGRRPRAHGRRGDRERQRRGRDRGLLVLPAGAGRGRPDLARPSRSFPASSSPPHSPV